MNKALAIAAITIREAFRQKLAVNLLIFAIALVAASFTISTLTFGEQYRIIVSIALSAMEIFGTLIAAFLGAALIARDVESRTAYPIIAKAVSRTEYLIGRYIGLVATVTLNLVVMAIVFACVLGAYLHGFAFVTDGPLLAVLTAMGVQFSMVAAVAVLFSSFSTTTLAAILTLSLVVAGHLASELVRYWGSQGGLGAMVGKGIYILVPNLEALNLKAAMIYKESISPSTLTLSLSYGVAYAAAVLGLACTVFSRRDLR